MNRFTGLLSLVVVSLFSAVPLAARVTLTKIADLPLPGDCAGWVTSGGAAYLQQLRYHGRRLYLAQGESVQLIAEGIPAYAPDDEEPVPRASSPCGRTTTREHHARAGAALLVVENVTGEQIAAYATLVDNGTNDSTYLGSQLGARGNELMAA